MFMIFLFNQYYYKMGFYILNVFLEKVKKYYEDELETN